MIHRVSNILLASIGVFWLVFMTGDCIHCQSLQKNEITSKTQNANSSLRLVVSLQKPKIGLHEKLSFHVKLTNHGKQPLYIYRHFNWGHSASLNLILFDENGRVVEPVFIEDSLAPEVANPAVSNAVLLDPNRSFETKAVRRLDDLGINKPGKYRLFVEYHSPILEQHVDVRPFWGKERSVVRSNSVWILVTRTAKVR